MIVGNGATRDVRKKKKTQDTIRILVLTGASFHPFFDQ
jgi:hypothetical protein